MSLSTFLTVVSEYSEIMACVGILLLLYVSLFLVSVVIKALEDLRIFPVTWYTNFFKHNKRGALFPRKYSFKTLKNFFTK